MWIGQFITPFVQEDLMMAAIMLMWVGAILSAAIDNIPFTAAMIPIILSMDAQGINVSGETLISSAWMHRVSMSHRCGGRLRWVWEWEETVRTLVPRQTFLS